MRMSLNWLSVREIECVSVYVCACVRASVRSFVRPSREEGIKERE